jgi:hypothetical protein
MDSDKAPRSQSPNRREDSPDEGRPRAQRKTQNFYQSTLTTSLKDSKEWNKMPTGSYIDPKFNASLSPTAANFQTRRLDRVGTVTEGMLNVNLNKFSQASDDKESRTSNHINVKFVDKNEWKDNAACYVCSRTFDKIKGVFTHHCRVCGRAVCGECSTKKINDNRVCDVCFYRANNPNAEERRRNVIRSKKSNN